MKVISAPLTEEGAEMIYNTIEKYYGLEMLIEIHYPERIICKVLTSIDDMEETIDCSGLRAIMLINYEGNIHINIDGDYTLGELELVYLLTQLIYKLKGGNKNGNQG